MDKSYYRALSIAGSDSGGGAGIQADLKTFSALGCFGSSAITAITAQNTLGVLALHPIPVEFLKAQILAVLDDIGTDAIKIGMLHSSEMIRVVAETLKGYPRIPVVLDPVMVATSGDALLQSEAIRDLKEILLPLGTVITPNIPEAELLLGRRIKEQDELPQAAKDLGELGCRSVLLKAGHLREETLVDYFYDSHSQELIGLPAPLLETRNTHGTGCTLSSAVAAGLARGESLEQAVRKGKAYLTEALKMGRKYTIGKGYGPVHHFHSFWA